ncbi:cytochrome c oxidase subunit 6a, mitochondrial-like [Senna tora]|uniref:Cytochrome c oxidase subunit 6a, mitochondrial-like n=1 Tax=Senna tora TaxID=362788 RepID=A0A834SWD8_9FABA|nr:cytochrome c oxidase subunit 6a, mitochondrial-like [Senna tora]
MAMAVVRSSLLRTALRRKPPTAAPPRRNFASAGHHSDEHETAKWEKITYLGIATCTVLSIYNLSKGHPHHEEPPLDSYLTGFRTRLLNLFPSLATAASLEEEYVYKKIVETHA